MRSAGTLESLGGLKLSNCAPGNGLDRLCKDLVGLTVSSALKLLSSPDQLGDSAFCLQSVDK